MRALPCVIKISRCLLPDTTDHIYELGIPGCLNSLHRLQLCPAFICCSLANAQMPNHHLSPLHKLPSARAFAIAKALAVGEGEGGALLENENAHEEPPTHSLTLLPQPLVGRAHRASVCRVSSNQPLPALTCARQARTTHHCPYLLLPLLHPLLLCPRTHLPRPNPAPHSCCWYLLSHRPHSVSPLLSPFPFLIVYAPGLAGLVLTFCINSTRA